MTEQIIKHQTQHIAKHVLCEGRVLKTKYLMETIKKFTAVQINTKKVDNTVIAEFEYGRISGPYYDVTEPKTEFDTEQEAIEWAYEEDKYADWLILTKISFKREY